MIDPKEASKCAYRIAVKANESPEKVAVTILRAHELGENDDPMNLEHGIILVAHGRPAGKILSMLTGEVTHAESVPIPKDSGPSQN